VVRDVLAVPESIAPTLAEPAFGPRWRAFAHLEIVISAYDVAIPPMEAGRVPETPMALR
jgi:hypothetical protein